MLVDLTSQANQINAAPDTSMPFHLSLIPRNCCASCNSLHVMFEHKSFSPSKQKVSMKMFKTIPMLRIWKHVSYCINESLLPISNENIGVAILNRQILCQKLHKHLHNLCHCICNKVHPNVRINTNHTE